MISVADLTIKIGTFSIERISFSLDTGEYGVLMGKTGSGKTTLLEAICGLRAVHSGTIELMGVDVTHLKPALRGVGFVPQDAALFTTMTVRDQLGFALSIRKRPSQEIRERVNDLSELLGIGYLLERKANGLSGGEKQRVSLGRALAARPNILCLDEPLSALDDETREGMYDMLISVQEQTGVTVLHITHNREDAMRLANRTLVLKDGKLMENGSIGRSKSA